MKTFKAAFWPVSVSWINTRCTAGSATQEPWIPPQRPGRAAPLRDLQLTPSHGRGGTHVSCLEPQRASAATIVKTLQK